MDLVGSSGEMGSSMFDAGDSIGVAAAKCTTMFPATSKHLKLHANIGVGELLGPRPAVIYSLHNF